MYELRDSYKNKAPKGAVYKEELIMFSNTLSHIKTLVKESLSLIKTVSIGTITAVKNDIREELDLRKEVKALRESKLAAQNSTTSSPNAHTREEENA